MNNTFVETASLRSFVCGVLSASVLSLFGKLHRFALSFPIFETKKKERKSRSQKKLKVLGKKLETKVLKNQKQNIFAKKLKKKSETKNI